MGVREESMKWQEKCAKEIKEMENQGISLEEMKNIEFGILKFFKNICDKHELNYYLAYGTLLGAVRHQGFIPWDDDVDVIMPREDYYRLVNIMKNEKKLL